MPRLLDDEVAARPLPGWRAQAAQLWLDGRVLLEGIDRRLAFALHGAARHAGVCWLLARSSRLADGPLWALVLLALAVFGGVHGQHVAQQGIALAALNLALYWSIKRGTRRERPYRACPGITARAPAPDAYSFPSGHTLHAAAFAMLLASHFPALALPLWALALLVAGARVVLGLHYPSDVLAGAMLGAVTARLVMLWI